jgi:hypothetical protein
LPITAESSVAKALVNLASGEFADNAALQQVVDMMNDIRSNLVNGITTDTADEEKSQADYEAEKTNKLNENREFETTIVINTSELGVTENKISENENFLYNTQTDLKVLTKDLNDENDGYNKASQYHEDLMSEL